MIPTERRQIILDMVAEKGIVSIAELTERMHVSHMTIRRDLQKLEQQGAVIQVSGGVQSSTRVAHEPRIRSKPNWRRRRKRRLANWPPAWYSQKAVSTLMQVRPRWRSPGSWLR
ncbi:DeoR family transcriptional regulator [Salmonella enterica subsp. enterica]|uniref:DeoR family transcriptional regulator n=1 Tax=Salmonella enterica I TaxID=59201 RepID=A0A379WMW7_SALET|nr:DeoR family transcriptional regulator [Salmonella enterica subsp. enterica]